MNLSLPEYWSIYDSEGVLTFCFRGLKSPGNVNYAQNRIKVALRSGKPFEMRCRCLKLALEAERAALETRDMYKISERSQVCLECGSEIVYGRSDKKYCCDDCRIRSNNRLRFEHKSVRTSIVRVLDKNYRILDGLIKRGVDSVEIPELRMMGFNENCVTSWGKWRNHNLFMCYDIKYYLTPVRIYCISRVSPIDLKRR